MGALPLFSVVMATYNRAAVLRHAIASVLDSTLGDFEILVVGDHCTDETAGVVEAFADRRLQFFNLSANCGDQSGPTNFALERARGTYVAFLNQDDLYFPDHLQTAAAELERQRAGFLWSSILSAEPVAPEALERGEWRVRLASVPARGTYDPLTFCVASSWLVTRELALRTGLWRRAAELYVSPSQEWMFRVWRSGAAMAFKPEPGVLAVFSGARKGSYATPTSREHDLLARWIRERPRLREEMLSSALPPRRPPLSSRILTALAAPLRRLCVRRGVHPLSAHHILRLRRPGAVVDAHRRLVGLDGLP